MHVYINFMQIFSVGGWEIFPKVTERPEPRESISQVWTNLKFIIYYRFYFFARCLIMIKTTKTNTNSDYCQYY